ncbi:MAG TPA: hypothetical protein VK720_15985 [Terracidiphilus sp.]|nr:hypothetical protein [Terracidiphilus sp.]
MRIRLKDILLGFAMVGVLGAALSSNAAQDESVVAGPPPSNGGFFPLSQVHRGLMATAWTVFTGDKPEPMQVEILGVLRGARGPGHDMILAQLHGAKPEYTGVVAGMSGSPVYVGNRLLGSLSYRIGQFSKDPIAGITPIEQMLEVRDLPTDAARTLETAANTTQTTNSDGMTFQAMETPLVMSGFRPEAIKLWQDKMAGTGLEMVAAGGSGSSLSEANGVDGSISESAVKSVVPGSAVSAQLIRGDLEIAATCTVTYVDPKRLLACGHPILQAGPVSMPMTTTEVVATLASPLNAFKIVNTGQTIGSFTQDRDAAISGVLGEKAHMIPVHVAVHGGEKPRKLNFEVLDLPTLTPQAVMVSVYNALLQTNESTADTSYHITGSIALDGYPPSPLDLWAAGGDGLPSPLAAALLTGQSFAKLYSNGTRQGVVDSINLNVEEIPRNMQVTLESARVVSGDIVHAGDSIVIEATLRPWQQPARNVRIRVKAPDRLQAGNLRVMVSDAGTVDRTMDQPRLGQHPADLETALAQARRTHPADQIYVSLLEPETQANMEGQTLSGLPLSMANALEPLHAVQDVSMNGESAVIAGHAPAGGVLSGFQVLNLHIESGGGLH